MEIENNPITVKDFSEKYKVPEKLVWLVVEKLTELNCKDFVKDEYKTYPEFSLKFFLIDLLIAMEWRLQWRA